MDDATAQQTDDFEVDAPPNSETLISIWWRHNERPLKENKHVRFKAGRKSGVRVHQALAVLPQLLAEQVGGQAEEAGAGWKTTLTSQVSHKKTTFFSQIFQESHLNSEKYLFVSLVNESKSAQIRWNLKSLFLFYSTFLLFECKFAILLTFFRLATLSPSSRNDSSIQNGFIAQKKA